MSKFLTLDGLSHFLGKIKGIFVGAATNTTENHVVTFGTDGKTIKDLSKWQEDSLITFAGLALSFMHFFRMIR